MFSNVRTLSVALVPLICALGVAGSVCQAPLNPMNAVSQAGSSAPPVAAPPAIPRPEHPRPDFERAAWRSLNGPWGFRRDAADTGLSSGWFQPDVAGYEERILVPFPWQSARSGVADPDYRGVAWYRRDFTVPDEWRGQRVFLRFGAVDYHAQVWVNGQLLGEHEGGYTPFEFDVTDALTAGANSVVVRVNDPVPQDEIPHGKQRNLPPDPWDDVAFTPSSGIWQTVWIEARPPTHVVSAQITPDIDRQRATVAIRVVAGDTGPGVLELTVEPPVGGPSTTGVTLALDAGTMAAADVELAVPQPQLWDIDSPNLYRLTLRLLGPDGQIDTVHTTFGMRKIEARDGKVWLNNRPIYLMSALDQGYWPDGLYTAPSDEAIRADIAYAKSLGLNGLRKHLKVEDPRYAYWADRLGILLWCDTPNPTRFTPLARERLLRDLEGMIARDYNHPSIVVWSPYNESWGLEFRLDTNDEMQTWVAAVYDRIKAVDPTRLVVDNSGWSHVKTDIADSHYYTSDPAEWRGAVTLLATDPEELVVLGHRFFANGYRYQGEPLMMTEYGGGWRDDRSWDLRWQTAELRRHPQIVGYTYTELYDIEREYAGYALYDRTPKAFGYDVATINSADFIGLDYRGSATLRPGAELTVTPFVSAYGKEPLTMGAVLWRLTAVRPEGEEEPPLLSGSLPVAIQPYTVTTLSPLTLALPVTRGPVQLEVTLLDKAQTERARATLDLELFDAPAPRAEVRAGGRELVLRADPSAIAGSFWNVAGYETGGRVDGIDEALWGRDHGFVEIPMELPELQPGSLTALHIELEAGSRPPLVTMSTMDREQTTDLTISVNGVEVGTHTIRDLHANARGALSMINGLGAGQHGELVSVTVPEHLLSEIESRVRAAGRLSLRLEVKADAANRGGLTLFGDRTGRYGIDPSVKLILAPTSGNVIGPGLAGLGIIALSWLALRIVISRNTTGRTRSN